MIAYKPQSENPNAHPKMPKDYPWTYIEVDEANVKQIELLSSDGHIFISNDEYALLLLSLTSAYDQYLTEVKKEKDFERYANRAAVRETIMATMATNNMQRVRTGVWTVPQLVNLTQDLELKSLLDDVNTLSYELACQKIPNLTNPIVTDEIKKEWLELLQSNFF